MGAGVRPRRSELPQAASYAVAPAIRARRFNYRTAWSKFPDDAAPTTEAQVLGQVGGRFSSTTNSPSSMRSTVGILLVIVGIVLFVMGYNRQHSLAGHAADVGTSVANSVDGGARTPEHT